MLTRNPLYRKGRFDMLVVSSSLDHSVILGKLDGLETMLKVTVLGVRGNKVQLGFEVVPRDPDRSSEVRERQPDASPVPAENQGMDSTQIWDWAEANDVEANPQTGQ